MGFCETLGHRVAPVLFRLALGATFIWAGHGKVLTKSSYTPDDLAALANMGVSAAIAAARPGVAAPAPTPSTNPPASPAPAKSGDPSAPLPEPASSPGGALVASTTIGGRHFTGADFDAGANLAGLYRVALLLRNAAADPTPREDGSRPMRLWPSAIGEGAWPARLAWAVAITELVGGCLILVGFLARMAAIGVFGVMLGALWLATLGPAINAPKSFLVVLPDLAAFQAWQSFALQMCALACAFGVFTLGAGWLSVDGFVFGGRSSSAPSNDGEE